MKIKSLKNIVSIGIACMPAFVFAQGKTLQDIINMIVQYLNVILVLLMAVAFVWFIFNVLKYYVINTEGDRKEAHMYVLYSIIGFFMVLSFWGVVNIVMNTFNLDNNTPSSWTSLQNLFPQSSGGNSANRTPGFTSPPLVTPSGVIPPTN
jgi:hypothetical protein